MDSYESLQVIKIKAAEKKGCGQSVASEIAPLPSIVFCQVGKSPCGPEWWLV